MADFVNTSTTKSAVRKLRDEFPSISAFDAIVQSVLTNNPWGCVPYQYQGVAYPAVGISKEQYTGKVQYQNAEGKVIGTISAQAPTQAALGTLMSSILGNTSYETEMGGDAVRNPLTDKFSCTLRCNAPSGDLYYVTFSRDRVRVSSYAQDAVLDDIEIWADGITALN